MFTPFDATLLTTKFEPRAPSTFSERTCRESLDTVERRVERPTHSLEVAISAV